MSAPPDAPALVADPDQVAAWWDALVRPGDVTEVRVPKTRKGPARLWGVASGYFDDRDAFVAAVAPLTGHDAEAVYACLNPVNPDLLARACNRLRDGRPPTTADADVVRRRHLLVDVDPVRPSGVSATDGERAAALARRDTISAALAEAGWPPPVARLATGNGGGLLYRVRLDNTPEATRLVERILRGLAAAFGDAAVTVDTAIANAARIAKIPGTVAAKGDDVPGRPWRLASAEIPGAAVPVPAPLLEAVAAWSPEPATGPATAGDGGRRDVGERLRAAGFGFREMRKGWGTVYALDRCPASADHADDGATAVFAFPSGALAFRCLHNRCAGVTWPDVRERLGFGGPGPTITIGGHRPGEHGDGPSAGENPEPGRRPDDGWPVLDPAALHGLAGEVVRAIGPHTEGDPAATLANYLVLFGNAVGPTPHCLVGERRHHANEFAALVGDTSKGRKGTSHDAPQAIVAAADPGWAWRVQGGLASGEGLVWAVRDPITKTKKGVEEVDDPGVADKRLMVVEEEFSAVCKVATREGNTLSEVLRRAWDGKPLGNLTKNSPARCGSPHISVLAHVTQAELLRVLDSTEAANGFGNRFLWVCVRRSKLLPEGGRLGDGAKADLVEATRQAIVAARRTGEVRRDAEAKALWAEVYGDLSAPGTGLWGAMADRAEAHALRLSLLYALLDGTNEITADHLLAALALWDYCAASARRVFGDALGDPNADRVLAALRSSGPLDRTDLNALFGRHLPGARLEKALAALLTAGKAKTWKEATGGRSRSMWAAA